MGGASLGVLGNWGLVRFSSSLFLFGVLADCSGLVFRGVEMYFSWFDGFFLAWGIFCCIFLVVGVALDLGGVFSKIGQIWGGLGGLGTRVGVVTRPPPLV